MAGVDSYGFTPKDVDTIIDEIGVDLQTAFGSTFDVSPESPDGQLIGIQADALASQWEIGEAVFNAYNPAVAFDVGLDNLCRLNNVIRIQGQPTTAAVQTDDDANITGTLIPAGTVLSTDTGVEFTVDADTLVPNELSVTCTESGAIAVAAGEISIVDTAIVGFTVCNNKENAITGITRETNTQLRARRARSVIRSGTNTAEAIYAAVADLNLEFIAVLENDTDETVDGMPPNSFHTVAYGGTESAIAERIFANKPTGIRAFGDISITINDSQGIPHRVGLSRPTDVPIYVNCVYTLKANTSVTAPAQTKQAIADYINALQISEDVYWSQLFTPATSVSGVLIHSLEISRDGSTFGTEDVPLGVIERAVVNSLDNIVMVDRDET